MQADVGQTSKLHEKSGIVYPKMAPVDLTIVIFNPTVERCYVSEIHLIKGF